MQNLIKYISFKYSILDAYLIKSILPGFIFSIIVCSIVAELIGISFEQIRFVTEWDLPITTSIYVHYLKLPSFIVIALPYAILFSIMFAYTRLSRSSEIIALQSFGVSLYRLTIPALVVGILATLIMFSLNELIVPTANYKAAIALEKQMNVDRNILGKYNKRNIIYKEYSDVSENSNEPQNLKFILFAEKFAQGKLLNLIILNYDNYKLTEIINSNSAEWDKKQQKWKLSNGERNLLISNGNFGERIYFKNLFINNISGNLWNYIKLNRVHREMHIWELYEKLNIIQNMEDVKAITKLKIDIFRRYINPWTCFLFALLGCAAGINRQSKTNSISRRFILVVAAILVYYTLIFFVLSSNGGNDTLSGGWGADTFYLDNNDRVGFATITDFSRAGGDTIQLNDYGANNDNYYSLSTGNWGGTGAQDTAIYYQGDLIARVLDSAINLNVDIEYR